jgi:hypothetical protein
VRIPGVLLEMVIVFIDLCYFPWLYQPQIAIFLSLRRQLAFISKTTVHG